MKRLTQEEKDYKAYWHNLLYQAIKEKGQYRYKKHGEYRDVSVYDDYNIELDTYSGAITVYKGKNRHKYLGLDRFGKISSDTDGVKFWYGHKSLFEPYDALG
jgi:hypothetical protein